MDYHAFSLILIYLIGACHSFRRLAASLQTDRSRQTGDRWSLEAFRSTYGNHWVVAYAYLETETGRYLKVHDNWGITIK